MAETPLKENEKDFYERYFDALLPKEVCEAFGVSGAELAAVFRDASRREIEKEIRSQALAEPKP